MRLFSGQIPKSRAWRQPGGGRVPCPGEQASILKALILGLYLKVDRSTLDWKTPWMEEPGRLQSMGSRRVRHD